jgi:hypothetical protein
MNGYGLRCCRVTRGDGQIASHVNICKGRLDGRGCLEISRIVECLITHVLGLIPDRCA